MKHCILLACSTLFPEKKDLEREAKKLKLPDSALARRASDMSENVANILKEKLSSAEFVSLDMDETVLLKFSSVRLKSYLNVTYFILAWITQYGVKLSPNQYKCVLLRGA